MKKTEIKTAFLKNIELWEIHEKMNETKANEYLKRNEITRHNSAFEESCRYNAMKHAIAMLGKEIGLFTQAEYEKIMED